MTTLYMVNTYNLSCQLYLNKAGKMECTRLIERRRGNHMTILIEAKKAYQQKSTPFQDENMFSTENSKCWCGWEKLELLCIAAGGVNWRSCCGKQRRASLKTSTSHYHRTQQLHIWVWTQRNLKKRLKQIFFLIRGFLFFFFQLFILSDFIFFLQIFI